MSSRLGQALRSALSVMPGSEHVTEDEFAQLVKIVSSDDSIELPSVNQQQYETWRQYAQEIKFARPKPCFTPQVGAIQQLIRLEQHENDLDVESTKEFHACISEIGKDNLALFMNAIEVSLLTRLEARKHRHDQQLPILLVVDLLSAFYWVQDQKGPVLLLTRLEAMAPFSGLELALMSAIRLRLQRLASYYCPVTYRLFSNFGQSDFTDGASFAVNRQQVCYNKDVHLYVLEHGDYELHYSSDRWVLQFETDDGTEKRMIYLNREIECMLSREMECVLDKLLGDTGKTVYSLAASDDQIEKGCAELNGARRRTRSLEERFQQAAADRADLDEARWRISILEASLEEVAADRVEFHDARTWIQSLELNLQQAETDRAELHQARGRIGILEHSREQAVAESEQARTRNEVLERKLQQAEIDRDLARRRTRYLEQDLELARAEGVRREMCVTADDASGKTPATKGFKKLLRRLMRKGRRSHPTSVHAIQ